jgi:hypothetical protein
MSVWAWFLSLMTPALTFAATPEAPLPPLLDPLPDRLLFLVILWVFIIALVIVLRWKVSLADTLFRMMPLNQRGSRKKVKVGESNRDSIPGPPGRD